MMDDPKIKFGKMVRQKRLQWNYSQEELAHRCDLDRTYIGGVERGERNISLINICKIAKALNTTPKTLLDFGKIEY